MTKTKTDIIIIMIIMIIIIIIIIIVTFIIIITTTTTATATTTTTTTTIDRCKPSYVNEEPRASVYEPSINFILFLNLSNLKIIVNVKQIPPNSLQIVAVQFVKPRH